MKLIGLIVIAHILPLMGVAQISLERKVVASVGSTGGNNDLQVDYTLGEPFVTTLSDNDMVLTQGFHQPNVKLVGMNTPLGPQWDAYHFPNPAKVHLNLEITGEVHGPIQLQVVDVNGRLIYQEEIAKDSPSYQHRISLSGWAAGTYFLTLVAAGKESLNIPFQKIQ